MRHPGGRDRRPPDRPRPARPPGTDAVRRTLSCTGCARSAATSSSMPCGRRTPPAAADTALRALLSKLRRVLPEHTLGGRAELRLSLPQDAFVDLEDARAAIHRAESALALGDWHRAWGASLGPLFTARRGSCPTRTRSGSATSGTSWRRSTSGRSSVMRRPAWAWAGPSWWRPSAPVASSPDSPRIANRAHRHLMRALAAPRQHGRGATRLRAAAHAAARGARHRSLRRDARAPCRAVDGPRRDGLGE